MKFIRITILTILVLSGLQTSAQEAEEVFGKNKVQYKNFDWRYIVSEHFIVYYYQGGNELAHNAARFAEEDIERITRLIGFDIDEGKKIILIIYNSKIDLQQSNIGIDDYYLVGGETKLIKKKVEIAFPGTQLEFKKEISTQISKLLVNIMMYGGSLKDMVQNSYVFHLPNWFIEGVCRYIGYGWDADLENQMMSIDLEKVKKPSFAELNESALIGHSVWSFIADKYGESTISNILHITSIVKNVETGISSSLAVSYHNFNAEWKNYYRAKRNYPTAQTSYHELPKLEIKKTSKREITEIEISPDGKKIAYTQLRNGKHWIMVYDLETKESTKILKGGQVTPIDKVQGHSPLISWKANNILGVLHYRKGYMELVLENVKNGDHEVLPFTKFEQIVDYDFSDDGKFIIFSALFKGRLDLWEYELDKGKFTQLTSNIFDELGVKYMPLSYDILFSSNRLNDTIEDRFGYFHQISDNFDLFILQRNEPVLRRLTNSTSSETNPQILNGSEIVFQKMSGNKKEFYKMNLASLEKTQLSDESRNYSAFSVSNNRFALAVNDIGKYQLAFKPDMNWTQVANPQELNDTIINEVGKQNDFNSVDEINIGSLVFETELEKAKAEALQDDAERQSKIWLAFPRHYEKLFGAEQVTSTFLIDQLRGTGILMDVSMTEMMGDHYLNAGVFGLTDLKSSNFFGEYRYLKRREDYYLKYNKVSMFLLNEFTAQRYTSNTFDLDIAYPFNVSNRVALSTTFITTRFSEVYRLLFDDVTSNYVGYGLEYVFDNTKTHGLNMIEGTRGKVYWNTYVNTTNGNRNFAKLKIDLRHYQRVHRDITWASRLSAGIFMGNDKKQFLLGGLDNWLFSKTNTTSENSPLFLTPEVDNSNLLFIDYATGMRGFIYNQRNGNKYFLINNEIRVPLIKYLHRSPVSSTFFRNLQFVAFYDFGAAWSGSSPFGRNNSYNTQTIGGNGNPFKAIVTNYRNPFLAGYGFGMRTVMLGYYVKLDAAWGVENFTLQAPVVYLTFGYDF